MYDSASVSTSKNGFHSRKTTMKLTDTASASSSWSVGSEITRSPDVSTSRRRMSTTARYQYLGW
jgi:hypothetical protein